MSLLSHHARFRADAYVERQRLAKRLRSAGTPADHTIAEQLEGCSTERPCRSGACPVCGGDLQLAAVNLVNRTIGIQARALRGRMTAITIVSSAGCVPPGDLAVDVCRRVRDELVEALVACNIPPCLFGLDISFNEDETGTVAPHWCVHPHGIIANWLTATQKSALRDAFPKSAIVKRPVYTEPLDAEPAGLLYAFKHVHERRVTYLKEYPPEAHRRSHNDTHSRSLRPAQSVALARVEHRFGLRQRLITYGIDDDAVEAALGAFERCRDGR